MWASIWFVWGVLASSGMQVRNPCPMDDPHSVGWVAMAGNSDQTSAKVKEPWCQMSDHFLSRTGKHKASPVGGLFLRCSIGKEEKWRAERKRKRYKVILAWLGLCLKLLCVFSAVSRPVEQHTKLADHQPGGSPCYSPYFVASNMDFGARPGLNFNKQVGLSVFSSMRASTVLLSLIMLAGRTYLTVAFLWCTLPRLPALRPTQIAIFVLYWISKTSSMKLWCLL